MDEDRVVLFGRRLIARMRAMRSVEDLADSVEDLLHKISGGGSTHVYCERKEGGCKDAQKAQCSLQDTSSVWWYMLEVVYRGSCGRWGIDSLTCSS